MICHTHILYSSVIYHTSNAWTQKTNWSCKQRVHSRCGRLRRIQTSAKHCRKDFVPPKRLWYIILIYCTWGYVKDYGLNWSGGSPPAQIRWVFGPTPSTWWARVSFVRETAEKCDAHIGSQTDLEKRMPHTVAMHITIMNPKVCVRLAFSKVIAFTIQQCYQH